jgi:hypothetical protein
VRHCVTPVTPIPGEISRPGFALLSEIFATIVHDAYEQTEVGEGRRATARVKEADA